MTQNTQGKFGTNKFTVSREEEQTANKSISVFASVLHRQIFSAFIVEKYQPRSCDAVGEEHQRWVKMKKDKKGHKIIIGVSHRSYTFPLYSLC